MSRKFFFMVFLLGCSLATVAQPAYFQDHKLPFFTPDSVRLKNALSGGFSLPQFSQADLNKDGWPDMVVFDRTDSQFVVFRNLGLDSVDTWRYDPSLDSAFAECNCSYWALMADYNDDGRQDLFCGGDYDWMKVFTLSFIERSDKTFYPLLTESHNPLPAYQNNGIPTYVTIQSTDIPAITDIDHDGDIDFLAFNDFTNSVQFFRNMAYDELSRVDTFYEMKIDNNCYGNFYEVSNGSSVILHANGLGIGCGFNKPAAGPRHGGGSTILALDIDRDYDKDLIIGDIGTEHAYVLRNNGSIDSVEMDTAWIHFPVMGTPFRATTFPAIFAVDTDNDQHKDILVAPSDGKDYRNQYAVNLYRDTSSNDTPMFAFQPRSFLQPSTLDLGGMAAPAFTDLNADGLMDLVVGTRGFRNSTSPAWEKGTLVQFLNTGTAANPAFTLTDTNYLHVADTMPNRQDLSPAFGDIDADGDQDLLVGQVNGKVMLYRNMAAPNGAAVFAYETDTLGGIDVGENASPAIFDVDGDTIPDLVVGNQRGWLYYYHNDSTPQKPHWTLITNKWGNIKANSKAGNDNSNGFIKPIFADFNQDGITDLLTGEEIGYLKVYDIGILPTDTFALRDYAFLYDFGKRSAPALAMLDTTGVLSVLVGNARGGLQLFRSLMIAEEDTTVRLPNAIGAINYPTWEMMPNPATTVVRLVFPEAALRTIEIADVTGRTLHTLHSTESTTEVGVADLPAGLYLVRVAEMGKLSARRLMVGQ